MGNMVKMERTKIQISKDTWKDLNAMKKPGESFDDVLRRIISVTKEAEG